MFTACLHKLTSDSPPWPATWPVNKFAKISEEIQNFACILLHEFTSSSKSDTVLLLHNRFESCILWPFFFCFKSLIEISKRKAQFLCKSPFCFVTMLLVSYESVQAFERKLFPCGKKFPTPIASQANQSIKAYRLSVIGAWWIFTYPQQWDGTFENIANHADKYLNLTSEKRRKR